MAMKKARPPKQPQKSDDTVIYNVMIALALVCLAIIALLQVGRLADYTDTMVQTYDATIYVAIIGAAVALASFIASLLLRSKMGRPLFGFAPSSLARLPSLPPFCGFSGLR